MSALEIITSITDKRLFVNNIRNNINKFTIKLKQTRAHRGDHGHERADFLAKDVTRKTNIDIKFYPTKYQLKKQQIVKYWEYWTTQWRHSTKGRWNFIQDVTTIVFIQTFTLIKC